MAMEKPALVLQIYYGAIFRGCFITTVKIVHKKNASAKGEDISKLFIC